MKQKLIFTGYGSLPELMAMMEGLSLPIVLTIENNMPRDETYQPKGVFFRSPGHESATQDVVFGSTEEVNKFFDHFAQKGQLNSFKQLFTIEFDDGDNGDGDSFTIDPPIVSGNESGTSGALTAAQVKAAAKAAEKTATDATKAAASKQGS